MYCSFSMELLLYFTKDNRGHQQTRSGQGFTNYVTVDLSQLPDWFRLDHMLIVKTQFCLRKGHLEKLAQAGNDEICTLKLFHLILILKSLLCYFVCMSSIL